MKEQLSAVVSHETGNVIGIFCNIDDAIEVSVTYEMRTGQKYEIEDVSKFGAHQMIDREWVKQTGSTIEMWASPNQP